MNRLINESMSDEAVCRTAPATPGLSNIVANANIEAEKHALILKKPHLRSQKV